MWERGAEWRIQYFSFPVDLKLSSLQYISVLSNHLEGYHDFLHKESVLFLTLHFSK